MKSRLLSKWIARLLVIAVALSFCSLSPARAIDPVAPLVEEGTRLAVPDFSVSFSVTGNSVSSNNYIYTVDANYLFATDISNPQNPLIKSTVYCRGCRNLVINGNYIYTIYDSKILTTFDISDPANPKQVFGGQNFVFSDFGT